MQQNLLTIEEASKWATDFLRRNVTKSNILYLIQYGKVRKYNNYNNSIFVDIEDLKKYYQSYYGRREDRQKFISKIKKTKN